MGVVKEGDEPWKCAVITLHKWLPSRSQQIAAARAWGIPELIAFEMDVSAIWIDDVRKVGRTTNWLQKLVDRTDLYNGQRQIRGRGDHVFFMNPLCVGWSLKIAEDTFDKIFNNGHMVYVHSMGVLYREGDDLTEFYDELKKNIKAAQQADFRAQQKST